VGSSSPASGAVGHSSCSSSVARSITSPEHRAGSTMPRPVASTIGFSTSTAWIASAQRAACIA
jgi:hypothetical protein